MCFDWQSKKKVLIQMAAVKQSSQKIKIKLKQHARQNTNTSIKCIAANTWLKGLKDNG